MSGPALDSSVWQAYAANPAHRETRMLCDMVWLQSISSTAMRVLAEIIASDHSEAQIYARGLFFLSRRSKFHQVFGDEHRAGKVFLHLLRPWSVIVTSIGPCG